MQVILECVFDASLTEVDTLEVQLMNHSESWMNMNSEISNLSIIKYDFRFGKLNLVNW